MKINNQSLKGDIFGGVTAGIVALPLALAFGVQSGLGAASGLYGAIGLGIFAALFGGTNTQISGPTGPMTVVSATTIALLIAQKGSLESALPAILLCFVLTGAFMILMGILKLGQYIKYIPYPVVSGFMTGIGVIIIMLQLFPMLGYESPKTIPQILVNIGDPLRDIHYPSLGLTVLTMIIVYLFPKVSKTIPSTLVALISVTVLAWGLSMDVAIIGAIPSGLPNLHFELFTAISDFNLILMPAVTLAALGAIDSLLTSVVADNVTKTSHESNKELVGQGIGNMVAGMIGGIPGAGATMRTLVNINSGGTTKMSGVIHGVFLLLVLLGLSSMAALIPIPVLSGILLTVGISIVDKKGLSHIGKITKTDAIVLIIVLILTVFVDLLQAVAAGMIISSIIFIKQMGDITQKASTTTSIESDEEAEYLHDRYHIDISIRPFVSIKTINGPLFFGNSEYFMQLSKKIPDAIKLLIIDMRHVPYIDQSGLYSLESIILSLEQNKVQVYLLNLQKQPHAMMKNILLIPNVVESNSLFDDELLCAEAAKKYIEQINKN
ncbi:MAG: SulP family inorganic anion transporter [Saprospiraceae bacterium]|nr:SulP family inorganic anion transporter [Saprospiraceae bacterium]MBK9582169.1 SulP family inorganic anion transporter [Saprospiraceae bacterium]MBP8212744.1 SulP family inorganic anion transporter [Saprospiraceae bacterium]HQV67423.1 SulP family inorganic anion transporter [Saprospiraceae bacterium]